MKRKTFVGLINSMKSYYETAKRFGEEVSNAYANAGCERDFIYSTSYEPPYGNLFDNLVNAIAEDFDTSDYPSEYAVDLINWWMWECDFGKSKHFNIKDNSVKPCEITFSDGKTMNVTTPSKLYDAIKYDMKLKPGK